MANKILDQIKSCTNSFGEEDCVLVPSGGLTTQ